MKRKTIQKIRRLYLVFSIILGVEVFSLMQWIGGFVVVLAVIYYSLLDSSD